MVDEACTASLQDAPWDVENGLLAVLSYLVQNFRELEPFPLIALLLTIGASGSNESCILPVTIWLTSPLHAYLQLATPDNARGACLFRSFLASTSRGARSNPRCRASQRLLSSWKPKLALRTPSVGQGNDFEIVQGPISKAGSSLSFAACDNTDDL